MNRPFVLPLAWALVILILCGIPGRDIPHISFLEILSFDKWVHAGIFFVLVVLLIRWFRRVKREINFKRFPKIFAVLLGIAYGVLMEALQALVFEDRSADAYDVIANSFGCVMAIALYDALSRRIVFLR